MLIKTYKHKVSVEISLTLEHEIESSEIRKILKKYLQELSECKLEKVKVLEVEEGEITRERGYKVLRDTVLKQQTFEWNCLWKAWSNENYDACQEAASQFPNAFPLNEATGSRVPSQAYGQINSGTQLLNGMKHLEMEGVEGYENGNLLTFLRSWAKEQKVRTNGGVEIPRFLIVNEDGSEEPYTG